LWYNKELNTSIPNLKSDVMKKSVSLFLLVLLVTGCIKLESDIKFSKVTPGGCAAETKSDVQVSVLQPDTVKWSFNGNTLNIFVGFMATCCGEYSTSTNVKDDLITIDIITAQEGLCDCICYYTYTFTYTGMTGSCRYIVKRDGETFKAGIITQ
jgi:hypothetical protein